jgi:hypothetical protein
MAPTSTVFALGPQLLYFSTDSLDFYFQNGGYIQDGGFPDF